MGYNLGIREEKEENWLIGIREKERIWDLGSISKCQVFS